MKNKLPGIIISALLLLFSCGNLVNDELADDDQDPPVADDSFGTIIESRISSAGNIQIKSAEDEGYFISGAITGENGKDKIWISSLDKNANRNWSAILNNIDTDDRISSINVIDKDNILIFADRYYPGSIDPENPDTDMLIIRVNSTRGIDWQKSMGDAKKTRVLAAAMTEDGGTIVTGITIRKKDQSIPFVMRISHLGETVWKKNYNKFKNKATPAEIINLGSDQYLLSGADIDIKDKKSAGFYCIIDGTITGEGKPVKSRYIKFKKQSISIAGNINSNSGILSVTGFSDTASTAGYYILMLNKDTLKVSSKKKYVFSDFDYAGKILKGNSDDFIIAGKVAATGGNGLYFLRFNMAGTITNLNTKYYDAAHYNIFDAGFGENEESSGTPFISRLNNGNLFIDRFLNPSLSKISMSKVDVIVTPEPSDDDDIEEEDVVIETENSGIIANDDPGLVFYKY